LKSSAGLGLALASCVRAASETCEVSTNSLSAESTLYLFGLV